MLLRVLSTALAVRLVITATFSFCAYTASFTYTAPSLTPGMTLIHQDRQKGDTVVTAYSHYPVR
jgi:hypothetical protein